MSFFIINKTLVIYSDASVVFDGIKGFSGKN